MFEIRAVYFFLFNVFLIVPPGTYLLLRISVLLSTDILAYTHHVSVRVIVLKGKYKKGIV